VLNFYYRIFEYFEAGPGQLLLRTMARVNMFRLSDCI